MSSACLSFIVCFVNIMYKSSIVILLVALYCIAAVYSDSGCGHKHGGAAYDESNHGQFGSARPHATKQSNTMSTYPRIGYPAPHFEGEAVVNGEFKQISLKDYKGKYLVLYFYPLDFTFVCPTEIIAFSEKAEEFRKVGAEIVGVSVDSAYTHAAWINTPRKQGGLGGINYPLLADVNHEVSQTYGVLYKNTGHTLRGLFIIGDDEHQTLRQITMNEPPVGRNVEEVLRLVKAFQFNDKNGEVCPANWTPGADTIVPDVNKKLKYFEKH